MIDFRVPPLGLSDGAVANGVKPSISLPGVSVCYSARLNRGSLLAPLGPNYIRAYPLFVMLFCVGMCFSIHCWQANSATPERGLNEIFLPRKSRKLFGIVLLNFIRSQRRICQEPVF